MTTTRNTIQKALPKGWKWVRLGEVCEFIYGDSLPERKRQVGNVPVFGSNGIVGAHDSPISDGETIIIGRKGSVGEINFSPNSCFPIDTTYFIDKRHTQQNIKWLYWSLKSLKLDSLSLTVGVPGLNRKDAYKVKFPLPPLPTQHKIVETLDEADNLRKLRKQADDKMKDLIPSLFVQMFGDPSTNPKEWDVARLKDLAVTVKNGLFKRPHEFGSGVPLINVVDLFAEYKVDLTRLERVTASSDEIEKYFVEDGDLFFCRSSLKKEGVAKCAVALGLKEPTVFECHTIMVRLNKKVLKPLFASIYLNHPGVRTSTVNTSQTATMTTVGQKDILRQKIFLPPLPLQQEFAKLVEDIEADKTRQAESRKKLDELFNSLMQRAFTGELVA